MSARTIADGAGVTNHFSAAFAPFVSEAGFTSISGIKDELSMTDGPDNRGYMTGRGTRQTLSLVLPAHDPACAQMHQWLSKAESGIPGYIVTGTVTQMDLANNPIAIYEIEHCIPFSFEPSDMSLDGGEVALETFQVSYSRAKRIGP